MLSICVQSIKDYETGGSYHNNFLEKLFDKNIITLTASSKPKEYQKYEKSFEIKYIYFKFYLSNQSIRIS